MTDTPTTWRPLGDRAATPESCPCDCGAVTRVQVGEPDERGLAEARCVTCWAPYLRRVDGAGSAGR